MENEPGDRVQDIFKMSQNFRSDEFKGFGIVYAKFINFTCVH